MVDGLSAMITERLHRYKDVSKALPVRVFVYRDGVSEVCVPPAVFLFTIAVLLQTQYDTVLETELPRILDAFKRVPPAATQGKPYRPTLTIIVCGKRHHAKLFPDKSEFADRNGNTRPGTVVDKGITSVYVLSSLYALFV